MKFVIKHPVIALAVILAITALALVQIPNVKMDNEVFNFLPEGSKERLAMKRTNDLFGDSMPLIVDVRSERGSIVSKEGVELVTRLSKAFEAVTDVTEVQSFSTMDFIEGTAEGLSVKPLADGFDGTPESVALLSERLKSWDLYDRFLVSRDGKSTQIVMDVNLDADAERKEAVYDAVKAVLRDNPEKGFSYYIAGIPSVSVLVNQNMRKDVAVLIPFVCVVVVLALFLSFKRLGGVLLPLLTVLISTIWTIGLMAALSVPLSLLGTIIPVVMIAVGSAYGIHVISDYYDKVAEAGAELDAETHREIIWKTLKAVGLPVFLAGETTIIGFGSIAVSTVVPMRVFGIFTAIGVVFALVVALVFIPAALALRHRALKGAKEEERNGPVIGYLVDRLAAAATKHKAPVLAGFVVLFAASAFYTTKVVIDQNMVEYFKEGTEVRVADSFIRKNFAGTIYFDMVVRGGAKGDLNDPRALEAMEGLRNHIMETYPEVAKVISYTDFLKRINQALHADAPAPALARSEPQRVYGGGTGSGSGSSGTAEPDSGSFWTEDGEAEASGPAEPAVVASSGGGDMALETAMAAYYRGSRGDLSAAEFMGNLARVTNYRGADFYEVPTDPAKYGLSSEAELKDLVAQYLLLFSGNLGSWADDSLEPMTAKMTVQLDDSSARSVDRMAPDIERWARDWFPEGYTLELSGSALAQSELNKLIVSSAIWSMITSIVLVLATLAIAYRSIVAGLVGSIPLAFTVIANFGVMGFLGIKLDISTAMIGSLAIGIGVDYSIHFLASYRRNYLVHGERDGATSAALRSTGKAIIFNAASVALGFAVLMFSQFNPIVFMGFLVTLTMFTSSLAAMTLLPVLLNVFKPKFIVRPERAALASA